MIRAISVLLLLVQEELIRGESQTREADEFHCQAYDFHVRGENEQAKQWIVKAIELNPHQVEYYNTLGVIQRALGNIDEAEESFRLAITSSSSAMYNYANLLLHSRSKPREAIQQYKAALNSTPRNNSVAVLMDFAFALERVEEFDQSIEVLHQAIEIQPKTWLGHGNLAMLYLKRRNSHAALHHITLALDINPNDARLHHNCGNILQATDRDEEAKLHWERAVELDHTLVQSHCSLGIYYGSTGEMKTAQESFKTAMRLAELKNDRAEYDGAKIQYIGALLPRIYMSTEEIRSTRQLYQDSLDELLQAETSVNFPNPIITTGCSSMGYYLIYQAFDDKILRQKHAQVYRKGNARLNFTSPHVNLLRHKSIQTSLFDYSAYRLPETTLVHPINRKLRIGFVSGFFYYHSVGLLMQNVITGISRDLFQVFVLNFPSIKDEVTERIRASADQYIELHHDIYQAQQQISALELDILVFTEIGMHSYTYFLAFSRLAPRTALFWYVWPQSVRVYVHNRPRGHAITSGLDTIDYFVTSKWFQSTNYDSDNRYTECLYRMQDLSTSFSRPIAPDPEFSRNSFDFPADHTWYLIPQTLYKIHPDFDHLLQGILSKDDNGIAIFPIGQVENLAIQLKMRFERSLSPDVLQRIHFAPKLQPAAYLALCKLAQVVLDPFPVGGGRSSFEIFSVGTPIVMLYPRTSILQLTYGMYSKMGIYDCISYTEQEFIDIAIRLGTNPAYRETISRRILQMNDLLYQSQRVVEEWNEFLLTITAHPAPTPDLVKQCPLDQRQDEIFSISIYLDHLDKTESIVVYPGEDPVQLGRQFATRFDPPLEPIKEHYVIQMLQNGVLRYTQPIVAQWNITFEARKRLVEADIHFGDDLMLHSLWLKRKYDLSATEHAQLFDFFIQKHPEHASLDWINVRKRYVVQKDIPVYQPSDFNCLTLILTTCKRLELFTRTISSLRRVLQASWDQWICHVVIIDDNSSLQDRFEMLKLFPEFEFVFKAEKNRGHANSMNRILSLVKTRFLLYVEDDWEFETESNFIQDALMIFQQNPSQNLVQILINDQKSGWKNVNYRYSIHEYASAYPSHTFRYWPGFSLNPGVWDIEAVRQSGLRFNPESELFERDFSLQIYKTGFEIGYLSYQSCKHIGNTQSAYVLNDLARPFDIV